MTPWGLYKWIRIPLGLLNTFAHFHWHMENWFEGWNLYSISWGHKSVQQIILSSCGGCKDSLRPALDTQISPIRTSVHCYIRDRQEKCKSSHMHHAYSLSLRRSWLSSGLSVKERDYLIGSSCILCTGNNLHMYVVSTAKLNAAGCVWVAKLADFHITNKYCWGRENTNANSLSTTPVDTETIMEE